MTINILKAIFAFLALAGGYIALIYFSQKSILKWLKKADFQIENDKGIYHIVDKNTPQTKVNTFLKEFKSLKKDGRIKAFNSMFNSSFSILLDENFLDDRLNFCSEKKENVEMELEQVKILVAKIEMKEESVKNKRIKQN